MRGAISDLHVFDFMRKEENMRSDEKNGNCNVRDRAGEHGTELPVS